MFFLRAINKQLTKFQNESFFEKKQFMSNYKSTYTKKTKKLFVL